MNLIRLSPTYISILKPLVNARLKCAKRDFQMFEFEIFFIGFKPTNKITSNSQVPSWMAN